MTVIMLTALGMVTMPKPGELPIKSDGGGGGGMNDKNVKGTKFCQKLYHKVVR